ncbi:MAG: hypothetical protein P8O07_11725 [Crocinitomicaceae bacterium]|nr:hypothetical protein [Crocinitomicaceae bacterium]
MENELIDDFQSGITQNQTESKQRGIVKTFGWISFGIAIFYLFSGLVSLLTTSVMSSVSEMASAAGNNELNFIGRISGMQQLNAGLTAIIALLIIVSAVGFVTFKEWGRKLYIAGCIGALVVNLIGIYIAIYSMSIVSEMANTINGMTDQEAVIFENVMGSFGSFFSIIAIIFSLIPLTYLVINIFISVNPKTKALMS